ncbi:hypothetical protein BC833DRAFT_584440 [Globomyces pollinis-pini]|nr:hypothetical protein BC833DRAFT_584440 [Globomyces pollinis-pini]
MDPVAMLEMGDASPYTKHLLDTADKVLAAHKQSLPKVYFPIYILNPHVVFALVIAAVFIYNRSYEGVLFLAFILLNIALYERDQRLISMDYWKRLNDVVLKVKKFGINYNENILFSTNVPTISITRVYRNDELKLLPTNLLVQGDSILLGLGDYTPTKVSFTRNDGTTVEFASGILLKAADFDPVAHPNSAGLFEFTVLETPLQSLMEATLGATRPKPVIEHHLSVVESLINFKFLWIVLFISLGINLLRVLLINTSDAIEIRYFQLLGMYQGLLLLPLLPISYPFILLLSHSYGNAYILTLFDALQSSKTDFEDKEDVDEFDAAPAPTKDLKLSWVAIFKKFVHQMTQDDGSRLARMTELINSLSTATVLCAIDREGSISSPLPAVEQLFFIGQSGESIVLDVAFDSTTTNGVIFEDKDWKTHLKLLKPLGLSFLLNTDCGIHKGRRRNEVHLKSDLIPLHTTLSHPRQTCLCHIAREIGFSPTNSNQFQKSTQIETFAPHHQSIASMKIDYHYEIPSITSQLFSDSNGSFQSFSEGSVDLILESCGDYWNGSGLGQLNEVVEKKILEFQQNAIICDLEVVAYSYRPLQNLLISSQIKALEAKKCHVVALKTDVKLESDPVTPIDKKPTKRLNRNRQISKIDSDTTLPSDTELVEEITKGQTFLCASSFIYPPKPNMVDFIEDLALAGIRFVYFSSAPERESKSYAERLGLEIDWNSCIILSPPDGGPGYLALHDMNAQLPRGVHTIRDHIANVDDVPLHVSLFAECRPDSIGEMVKIFQEHGEVVCCFGSALNNRNVAIFANVDVGIAIDPIPLARHRKQQGPLSPLVVSSEFIGCSCALSLNADVSLYSVTQMIREARSLADNGRQVFAFYFGVQLALITTILISYCSPFLPPIFTAYQLMFILWVIAPSIALSLLFTPHHSEIMTHHHAKNKDHGKDVARFLLYFIIRYGTVPAISCVAIFWLILYHFTSLTIVPIGTDHHVVLFAQNFTLCFFTLYMVVISSTCVHRNESILSRLPTINKPWLFSSILCIILQILFFTLSSIGHPMYLSSIPWYIYAGGFSVILLILPIQEIVKKYDRKEWMDFQKRSKLEFNTKLGMHSPL